MRYIVVLTLVAVLSIGYSIREVQAVRGFMIRTGADLRDYFYDPEVVLDVADGALESELRELLPVGESILWWGSHTERLQAALRKHPVVKEAVISRCDTLSSGCFKIAIEKRTVRALAFVGQQAWLIDRDGEFVVPVLENTNAAVVRSLDVKPEELPVLKGASQKVESPQIIHTRLRLAVKALNVIEEVTKQRIRELVFSSSGEMSVRIKSSDVKITFSPAENDLARVRQEAERLVAVLSQADLSAGNIEQIDLALKRSAVVRYVADTESK